MNSTWGQAFLENAERKLKSGSTYFAAAIVAGGGLWANLTDAQQATILGALGLKGSTVIWGLAIAYFVTLFKPVAKPLPTDLTETIGKIVQEALKDKGGTVTVEPERPVGNVPATAAVDINLTEPRPTPTKVGAFAMKAEVSPDKPVIDPMLVDLYRRAKQMEPPATDDAIFQTYQLWRGKS